MIFADETVPHCFRNKCMTKPPEPMTLGVTLVILSARVAAHSWASSVVATPAIQTPYARLNLSLACLLTVPFFFLSRLDVLYLADDTPLIYWLVGGAVPRPRRRGALKRIVSVIRCCVGVGLCVRKVKCGVKGRVRLHVKLSCQDRGKATML